MLAAHAGILGLRIAPCLLLQLTPLRQLKTYFFASPALKKRILGSLLCWLLPPVEQQLFKGRFSFYVHKTKAARRHLHAIQSR